MLLPKVERQTAYTPVEVDGAPALLAESACAASALAVPLDRVDLRATPHLEWRWMIKTALSIPDERVKAGDDFAARVYVMFRFDAGRASWSERLRHTLGTALYGKEVPGNAINYVWSVREPSGATWDNPFTTASKMVSLGRGALPEWKTERVDVAADYRRLFGPEPPPLMALAIMADSDNSCQRSAAWFADFRFIE